MPLWIKTCVNKQLTGLVRSIFTGFFFFLHSPLFWVGVCVNHHVRQCIPFMCFTIPFFITAHNKLLTVNFHTPTQCHDEYVTLYTVCTTYVNCAHARAVYTKHKHKHIWTMTIKLNLHNGLTGYGCFELEFFCCNRSIVGYSATFSQPLFVFKQNLC